MPDLGFVVILIALSYAMGVGGYSLMGLEHTSWMRTAAFPLVGAIVGETLVPMGPLLLGFHVYTILVATLTGVLVDVAVRWLSDGMHDTKIGKVFRNGRGVVSVR